MIEEKLLSLGLHLPSAAKPVASYIPAVQTRDLVFCSGQLPTVQGELVSRGQVGADVSEQEAYGAARTAVLNCLAALKTVIGDLDRIERIVKLTGYVNSAPAFTNQPKVVNGASDLLLELFGEKGRHARAAVGAFGLPMGASVEIELVVQVSAAGAP